MDGVSFVKCSCPVKPNFPRPCQAPGLFNLFFLAWLSLRGAGKGWGSSVCLKSLIFQGGGERDQGWGTSEMESTCTSSEEPDSLEPLTWASLWLLSLLDSSSTLG